MEQRVILDLVSNFNSLKSFNFKKELAEKVQERRNGNFSDCSEEFELDKFDVVDYIQECVDVFNKIDSQIGGFYWCDEDIKIMKEYYPMIGLKVKDLLSVKRANNAIKCKAKLLGLTSTDLWTDEEIEVLKKYYPTEGKKVSKRLEGRNDIQCGAKAIRLGLKYNGTFTKEEINILKKYYPIEGSKCFKRIKNKTKKQCAVYCNNHNLKIIPLWSTEEIEYLKKNYPVLGIKCFDNIKNKTKKQCQSKVEGLKLKKLCNIKRQ